MINYIVGGDDLHIQLKNCTALHFNQNGSIAGSEILSGDYRFRLGEVKPYQQTIEATNGDWKLVNNGLTQLLTNQDQTIGFNLGSREGFFEAIGYTEEVA